MQVMYLLCVTSTRTIYLVLFNGYTLTLSMSKMILKNKNIHHSEITNRRLYIATNEELHKPVYQLRCGKVSPHNKIKIII